MDPNAANIAITDLDMPFWGITCLIIKIYFALIAASCIIALIFAAIWFTAAVLGISIVHTFAN